MTRRASKNWAEREIRGLLAVWQEREVQEQLAGAVRNREVFLGISHSLQRLGVQRDWKQCRAKVKNLKYEYRSMVSRRRVGRRGKAMRFYQEMDSVLGRRPPPQPQASGLLGEHLNVVIKEEEEAEDSASAQPPDFVTACSLQLPADSTEGDDQEVDKPLYTPAERPGLDSITAETEGPVEEQRLNTVSEDPATTSPKEPEPQQEQQHDSSSPRKRLRPKKGSLLQRHLGTIISSFLDYQRKAEERFYKWEEERRREEREHEMRIIQLLLDHSRCSLSHTPDSPEYLQHHSHVFTPPPSNN
ncbi:myb/SANT-like DNA-binding domain-containing protein 1 [Callorhinchus milii]|uniref:Myb/SANT-like DNA-binding domain-containing protein 1 n=1 Tax=Callorhinchus milii TaxID=7868 RepID=A0A4W3I8H7_CALMI|nr:myb/SANT-like DNA-binding domain-containing protein 1 [Callorhinchus milii]|eukprot:gi/632940987/ref/XP_007885627.1/ PREDICTED: myb/SANT-like DNA-binding domain-containing protein 1 [Callorhinchus milii]